MEQAKTGALRNAFVLNLRRHRKRLGWSQEKLALLAGLNRVYLNGVEAGRRNVSLDNVERLAQALDVDPIELLLSPRTDPGPMGEGAIRH